MDPQTATLFATALGGLLGVLGTLGGSWLNNRYQASQAKDQREENGQRRAEKRLAEQHKQDREDLIAAVTAVHDATADIGPLIHRIDPRRGGQGGPGDLSSEEYRVWNAAMRRLSSAQVIVSAIDQNAGAEIMAFINVARGTGKEGEPTLGECRKSCDEALMEALSSRRLDRAVESARESVGRGTTPAQTAPNETR
ncbi:MAG: hypothetical protein ACQET9_09650 [Actinomycetota bacterium]